MANPAMSVGGVPLYPMAGGLLSGTPVIRPAYGGAGLLNDGEDFADVRKNFAGGLLNGFQYNPRPMQGQAMFQPIAPSGMYTTDQSQASTVEENNPSRGMTFADAFGILAAQADPMMLNTDGRYAVSAADGFQTLLKSAGIKLDPSDTYDPTNEDFRKAARLISPQHYRDTAR